ncbi:hypothetical protein EGI16_03670 [Chryseobacterium sp. G0240]|uniref:hypothetical protein n=1 Tax=Chryseobacterium sp. G0240 TaxID=2487066 RepID=UPI000F45A2D8|nr:hypothetical protein [Chryseobacterium sp. G0240]ROI05496.1 hypothetical protein EGI16_03670 [Chryseobacterium sp. G0240]
MKKLFFLLIPICAFSQERILTSSGKSVILNSDYTWKYEDSKPTTLGPDDFKTTRDNVTAGLISKVKIPIKNGEDHVVKVDFGYISTVSEFNQISFDKIQKMIDYSRNYVMTGLKNKYSFIPRKVDITYSNSNKKWAVMWNYTAKNSYGGDIEGNQMILFDNEINRVDF